MNIENIKSSCYKHITYFLTFMQSIDLILFFFYRHKSI